MTFVMANSALQPLDTHVSWMHSASVLSHDHSTRIPVAAPKQPAKRVAKSVKSLPTKSARNTDVVKGGFVITKKRGF